MIKSKAFSAFIVCSILISGISNSYLLGGDDEEQQRGLINGDDTAAQTSSSICTWKRAGLALFYIASVIGAGFGAYEIGKKSASPSSVTPALQFNHPMMPLKPNKPLLVCPAVIPLNGPHNCSSGEGYDLPYWSGAHMGEAVHSGACLPECTSQPDMKQNSFEAPKIFVCEWNSPDLEPLLKEMEDKNVPYYMGGSAGGFGGKAFRYYVYDSKTGFEVPTERFTVPEIENDPEAMKVITDFFEFSNDFYPTPCHEFILGEE